MKFNCKMLALSSTSVPRGVRRGPRDRYTRKSFYGRLGSLSEEVVTSSPSLSLIAGQRFGRDKRSRHNSCGLAFLLGIDSPPDFD